MTAPNALVVAAGAARAYIWARAGKVLPHVLMDAVLLIAMSFLTILGGVRGSSDWLFHLTYDDLVVFTALDRSTVALCSSLVLHVAPITVAIVATSGRIS